MVGVWLKNKTDGLERLKAQVALNHLKIQFCKSEKEQEQRESTENSQGGEAGVGT